LSPLSPTPRLHEIFGHPCSGPSLLWDPCLTCALSHWWKGQRSPLEKWSQLKGHRETVAAQRTKIRTEIGSQEPWQEVEKG
jgi:hypothetical protein